MIEILEELTSKIGFDHPRQIGRVARPAEISCFSRNDVFAKSTHIRGNHRQAEAICQEKDATLVHLCIRQHHDIRRFEVQLCLLIRNIFNLLKHMAWFDVAA